MNKVNISELTKIQCYLRNMNMAKRVHNQRNIVKAYSDKDLKKSLRIEGMTLTNEVRGKYEI